MRRFIWCAAAVLTLSSACAGEPTRTVTPVVVAVPKVPPRPSARDRAVAALPRADAHWWTVEAMILPIDTPAIEELGHAPPVPASAPPPLTPPSQRKGKSPGRVITIDACGGVGRALPTDPMVRRVEGMLATRAAVCFESVAEAWTGTIRVDPNGELSVPPTTDRLASCIGKVLATVPMDPPGGAPTNRRAFVRARPVGASAMVTAEWAATDHEAEISELEAMAAEAGLERDRAALLLGTRHMDAALQSPAARAPRAEQAQRVFATLIERPLDDEKLRAQVQVRSAIGRTLTDVPQERALRAIVCGKPAPDTPLPNDHTQVYWDAWERIHSTPIGVAREKRKTSRTTPSVPSTGDAPHAWDDETEYHSPYAACAPVNPDLWTAEAWFSLGRFHELMDPRGGPFALNRAETTYRMAAQTARGTWPLEGYARYALATVLLRQQRYREAVHELVAVLDAGESARASGIPELRTRALQLTASALTIVDFDGPSASEPYVQRPDILDTEPNYSIAYRKIAVALERVENPSIVPQDRAWTPEVVYWLAHDLSSISAYEQAAAASALFLRRWPLHRDAPVVQAEQARTFESQAMTLRPATPEHAEALRRGREARAQLAQYARASAWAEANRADSEAIGRAERLRTMLVP